MKKTNNLALFTLILVGIFSSFNLNLFAQKAETQKTEKPVLSCSGEKMSLPQSVAVNGEAFANFIRVMSLPAGNRQRAFSDSSDEVKADLMKVGLALQFIKRPNLTPEQKSVIIESVSLVSADTYSKENPDLVAKNQRTQLDIQQKGLAVFTPQEFFEIFANMNEDRSSDIALLKKYEEVVSLPTVALRKSKIRESTPEVKSEFWKAQMIYYLATANINKAQREFIVKTIPFLTANAFDFPKDSSSTKNEETKLINSFEADILKTFTKAEAYVIFVGYGFQRQASESISTGENKRKADCSCSNYWNCGLGDLGCTNHNCNEVSSGCGVWGTIGCQGICGK
jgi:hypothetical protein